MLECLKSYPLEPFFCVSFTEVEVWGRSAVGGALLVLRVDDVRTRRALEILCAASRYRPGVQTGVFGVTGTWLVSILCCCYSIGSSEGSIMFIIDKIDNGK